MPAIFEWRGRIAAGLRRDDFIVATDILPTIVEAASCQPLIGFRIDGKSFLSTLTQIPDVSTNFASSAILATKSVDWIGDKRFLFWFKDMVNLQ